MLAIGLTGGIASGKSTVSDTLKELGAIVINADLVGHEAYLPQKPAWKDLVETWGEDILVPETKEIDRRKLGGIVFSSPEALQTLNKIMWPRIYDMVAERFETLRSEGTAVVVLEAAILIEASWMPLVDEVWVTATTEAEASRRLQERNKLTEEQAIARIRSQITNDERKKHATVFIDTNPPIPEVERHVRELWAERIATNAP